MLWHKEVQLYVRGLLLMIKVEQYFWGHLEKDKHYEDFMPNFNVGWKEGAKKAVICASFLFEIMKWDLEHRPFQFFN